MTTHQTSGSSSYATGGGGVVLEHAYAASALAGLLLGQPVTGLGDDFVPTHVGLQQEAFSPVDDVLIVGTSATAERALRVACRRRPVLGKSDESTVKLFADYVRVVLDEEVKLASGALRLGLAVAGPFGPAAEVASLTEVARRQVDLASFEASIISPGAYTSKVRDRLNLIFQLVEAALSHLKHTADAKAIAWTLLRSLYVIQTQFEGDAAPGRTAVVAQLQVLTGNATKADELHRVLVAFASQAAIRAGAYARPTLRKALRDFGPLGASPDFAVARPQIELLEAELRRRTPLHLPFLASIGPVKIDRAALRTTLVDLVASARSSSIVLVHGEPDVGKSALALEAIESIRESGGVAMAMSLRDLPSSAIGFRSAIGLAPKELLARAPSAPVSTLLLDGVEAIQESESESLGCLIEAAAEVGMTTVIVVRDDAMSAVRDVVAACGITQSQVFVVPALADSEVATLVRDIPDLARLASDPRAIWLLRRIGLVELLLRGAVHGGGLPATMASEADLFASVWRSLIRRNEKSSGGVSADDRELAATAVARHLLRGITGQSIPGSALSSLRSDGVLLAKTSSSAWTSGDAFATDVLRDFALAKLLILSGLEELKASSAPRWGIRAARLFAQSALADAASQSDAALLLRWLTLKQQFDDLAVTHGARWAELPWEALLTAGWAERALSVLTPLLLQQPALRAEAVRCVSLRFTQDGLCDPTIGGPLLGWLASAHLLEHLSFHRDSPSVELMCAWLRALARAELAGDDITRYRPLRTALREILLPQGPEYNSWLEALGLMGGDSNGATAEALRAIAKETPHSLTPLLERPYVALVLARSDVFLLADLTQAYYIEESSSDSYSSFHDDGIRDHEPGGWGTPLAGWYRGPFLPLLRMDFTRGLDVINRMLDRGARRRNQILDALEIDRSPGHSDNEENSGLTLALFGLGPRLFLGDGHVWYWYRGTGVGPYPCVSALYCLDIMLDDFVGAGMAVRDAATLLLRNASTLATPALVFGFLVRHIDKVADELDNFLADPKVWRLEFGRVLAENHSLAKNEQSPLVGEERRLWNPRQVASYLVLLASQRTDAVALERLRQVGDRLIAAAGGVDAPPEVRLWAAHLDWNSLSIELDGSRHVVVVNPPLAVTQALAPSQANSESVFSIYALLNRYRLRAVTPYRHDLAPVPTPEQLAADYATSQRLQSDRGDDDDELDLLGGALAGVSGALLGYALLATSPSREHVSWAAGVLTDCALKPAKHAYASESSVFPDGADRKAALALPLALRLRVSPSTSVEVRRDLADIPIGEALTASMTSLSLEVRQRAAEGLRPLLSRPCSQLPNGECWHDIVWRSIEAALRRVALGAHTFSGRREHLVLEGEFAAAIAACSTQTLMLTRLIPPLTCVLEAARSSTCLAGKSGGLLQPLLDAYARTACYWAEQNYNLRDDLHAAFAYSLLRSEGHSNAPQLLDVARKLASSPRAYGDFLDALTSVATYDAAFVPILASAWPQLMAEGIVAMPTDTDRRGHRDRHSLESLLRNLVPDPKPSSQVGNIDAVVNAARANWLSLEVVTASIDAWLSAAIGYDWCVDALVGFLHAQPLVEQLTPGLEWVSRLVVAPDRTARVSGFLLMDWLQELRASAHLQASVLVQHRAIVDALVLSGYAGARELQQREEL